MAVSIPGSPDITKGGSEREIAIEKVKKIDLLVTSMIEKPTTGIRGRSVNVSFLKDSVWKLRTGLRTKAIGMTRDTNKPIPGRNTHSVDSSRDHRLSHFSRCVV